MLGTLVCALLLQSPPATKGYSYTGVPYLEGDGADSVAIPTHSAIIELSSPQWAKVSTVTVFKNTSAKTLDLSVRLPWRVADPKEENGAAYRSQTAVWNGKPVTLVHTMIFPPTDTVFKVSLAPNATASLKTTTEEPAGTMGLDYRQRVFGYALTGTQPIGQMNLTFRYAGNLSGDTVFRLPTPKPAFRWQVGDRGAFVRLTDYMPKDEVASIAFYPGDFQDIGR